jgi:hypothetical protein
MRVFHRNWVFDLILVFGAAAIVSLPFLAKCDDVEWVHEGEVDTFRVYANDTLVWEGLPVNVIDGYAEDGCTASKLYRVDAPVLPGDAVYVTTVIAGLESGPSNARIQRLAHDSTGDRCVLLDDFNSFRAEFNIRCLP